MTGPNSEVADRHRAAEGHEPQRHHARPLGVGHVLLEDRDQRRRRQEVGEAEDERDGERRAERADEGEGAEADGEQQHPVDDQPPAVDAGEHGADGEGAEAGADAPRRVQQLVAGLSTSMPTLRRTTDGNSPTYTRQTTENTHIVSQAAGEHRPAADDVDARQQPAPAVLGVGAADVGDVHGEEARR